MAALPFSMSQIVGLVITTLVVPTTVSAHDDGMDMSMDGAMTMTEGHMVPWLHFAPGDTLWFLGWVPESKGAILGACIGLFMLGLVDRWLAAIRAGAEGFWRRRARIAMANRLNYTPVDSKAGLNPASKAGTAVAPTMLGGMVRLRSVPPFVPAHDIARGLLHAAQAALGFAFMLAVMTFNVGFILSIVIGLGVGEMFFGRYMSANTVH